MPTKEDLKYFQSMPLDIKVAMTKTRIREWVTYFGVSGTYVSFSGGKDSTVLLHLVRELYPDMEAVFVNTGLEYPEIQAFAKSFNNVTVLRPEMPFTEVIKQHGYPFISKQISRNIHTARNCPDGKTMKRFFIEGRGDRYDCRKYSALADPKKTDFIIGARCCDVMKKSPTKKYDKQNGKSPIIATLACESLMREDAWCNAGCNAFESKHPSSQPLSFWTENDILQYLQQNDIKIAKVYGDIIPSDGQYQFEGCTDCIKLKTTGCDRTGCIFCGYGAHLEKESRFKRLKQTHPKQYDYCIGGGEYDIDGIWKPNKKGLGMGHVIDKLNELYSKNGKAFIEY